MMSKFPMLYIILLFEFVHYIWVFCLRHMDYVFGNETEDFCMGARVGGKLFDILISNHRICKHEWCRDAY